MCVNQNTGYDSITSIVLWQLRLTELTKDQSEAELIKKEKEDIKLSIEEREKAALEVYKEIEEQKRKQKEEEERAKEKTKALHYFQEIDTNNDGRYISVH